MKPRTTWLELLLIFISVVTVLYLCSCNPTKKDFNNVNTAILRSPTQTAKQFADKWPCVPVATASDSSALKEYLAELAALRNKYKDTVTVTDTLQISWADTVKIKYYQKQLSEAKAHEKYLNSYISELTELCQDKPAIHDTLKVEDYTKLIIISGQLSASEDDNAKLRGEANNLQSWRLWLLITCVFLLLGNILQFKFKR